MASKKGKIAPSAKQARRDAHSQIAAPGIPNDTASFISCYEIEDLTAGYLGCKTLVDFRRLLFSPDVLDVLLKLEKAKLGSKRTRRILDQIKLRYESGTHDEIYQAKSDTDYPEEKDEVEDMQYDQYALLVCGLKNSLCHLQQQLSLNQNVRLDGAAMASAESALCELKKYGSVKFPERGQSIGPFIIDGPQDLNESFLEPYNRTLMLLRHLQARLVPAKRGQISQKAFLEQFSAENPKKVMNRPPWMETEVTASAVPQTSQPTMEQKDFSLVFDIKKKRDKEIWEKMDNGELSVDPELYNKVPPEYDPRKVEEDQFRDGIRRAFRLHQDGLRLIMVVLDKIIGEDDKGEELKKTFGIYRSCTYTKWTEIQQICAKSPSDTLQFRFKCVVEKDPDLLRYEAKAPL